ncbi:hypothetical protein FIBSPDRAFT_519160 [Athelia psychrophila]|uniref:Uncharacterized protein n=1 Tax=Athelia psychrophila TaxID=1759441 RepID=A0A166JRA3_9AGAM|nr:hypothetical protein FIBSPDRAFT_519160 [Fibularhizoctonia sp. CBS 109695]
MPQLCTPSAVTACQSPPPGQHCRSYQTATSIKRRWQDSGSGYHYHEDLQLFIESTREHKQSSGRSASAKQLSGP